MSFNALIQDGKVYLVPASLEVPIARRNALMPVAVLGSWAQVPPASAPVVPAPAPVVPAPAPAPAPVIEPAAPPSEGKDQSGERRKAR